VFSLPLLLPIGLSTPPRSTAKDSPHLTVTQMGSPGSGSNVTSPTLPWSWYRGATTLLGRLRRWKAPSLNHLAQSWLLCLQLILGPQLFSLVIVSQSMTSTNASAPLLGSSIALLISAILIAYIFSFNDHFNAYPGGGLLVSNSPSWPLRLPLHGFTLRPHQP
jgi:hypothetical protein